MGNVLDKFYYHNSASFSGDTWATVFGPEDVQHISQIAIFITNHDADRLKSGSVEWSADQYNWETDWDTTTFGQLSGSQTRSMQITSNSRRYLRIRAIPSGSGGANTGSLNVRLVGNSG